MPRFFIVTLLLIAIITIQPHSIIAGQNKFVLTATAELNGDKKSETVTVKAVGDAGDFVLTIGTIIVKDKLYTGAPDGFIITDIDSSDKYKEVAVHSPGPSDDDEYLIYQYTGIAVKQAGRLVRWPVFPGNGIVYADDWLGFWKKREKYVLSQDHELIPVPQELYYVGVAGKVKESFMLYKSRMERIIVATPRVGSEVILLTCDVSGKYVDTDKGDDMTDWFRDWYLIKTETGLTGWAQLNTFSEKLDGLPWAD
ncbi:MAG: hypothetical protein WC955_10985 [Elusimicrobiota bacterium]